MISRYSVISSATIENKLKVGEAASKISDPVVREQVYRIAAQAFEWGWSYHRSIECGVDAEHVLSTARSIAGYLAYRSGSSLRVDERDPLLGNLCVLRDAYERLRAEHGDEFF